MVLLGISSCQKTFEQSLKGPEFIGESDQLDVNDLTQGSNLESFNFKARKSVILLENEKVSFSFAGKEEGYGIVQITDKSNSNYKQLLPSSSPSILW